MDNNLSNNQAIIIGTIEDEFVFNHEIYAEKFYLSWTVNTVSAI